MIPYAPPHPPATPNVPDPGYQQTFTAPCSCGAEVEWLSRSNGSGTITEPVESHVCVGVAS